VDRVSLFVEDFVDEDFVDENFVDEDFVDEDFVEEDFVEVVGESLNVVADTVGNWLNVGESSSFPVVRSAHIARCSFDPLKCTTLRSTHVTFGYLLRTYLTKGVSNATSFCIDGVAKHKR
jgi:hypothetical protein